jgi:tetratricopeptide (TPR) repeat protein
VFRGRLFFILIIGTWFFPGIGAAQNRAVDSLKILLKNATIDSIRCNYLLSLVGNVYLQDPVQALAYAEEAKDIAVKAKYLYGESESLEWLGYLYKHTGNTRKAFEYNNKNLQIKEQRNDQPGIFKALLSMSSLYKSQGDIDKAIDLLHRGLLIAETISDEELICQSQNELGLYYVSQGDIQKGVEFIERSIKRYRSMKDLKGLGNTLSNLGFALHKQRKFEESNAVYEECLTIKEQLKDKRGVAQCLNNIGGTYTNLGQLRKGLEYLMKSLEMFEALHDKQWTAFTLNKIAISLLASGKLKEAQTYAERSLAIAKELGYPENLARAAEHLKLIYKKENNFSKALEMFELEITMKDSINNETNRKASIRSQLKYEYEKQAAADSVAHAKESDIKSAELSRQSAELKAKKNQQYALFGGLALVIIFAGFMFNRFKITQKQKVVIERQKDIVEEQKKLVEEKQREILDSIYYARRIQRALLASEKYMVKNLERLKRDY